MSQVNHKSTNNPFGELDLRLNPGSSSAPPSEDEPTRTLIVGNLSDRVSEEILYELFLQAGPLSGIRMPRDKGNNLPSGMAFVVFRHPVSVDFALRLMSGIRLYRRELVLTKMGVPPNALPASQVTPRTPTNQAPIHYAQGYSDKSCYQNSRNDYMYSPPTRSAYIPPPPLFNANSSHISNHNSPAPMYRLPFSHPHSDPGYQCSRGDFRRSHVYHGDYTEQSRNGDNRSYGSYHKNETPKRSLPYSKASQSRGNYWR